MATTSFSQRSNLSDVPTAVRLRFSLAAALSLAILTILHNTVLSRTTDQ